jgi:hypothetical protein
MPRLKYYNQTTEQWEYVVVGAQGDQGEQGDAGPANTLTVGTVADSAPGSEPEVTITGTAPNQTINFVLPTGDTGPQGETGNTGVVQQSGTPSSTDVLWLDTDEVADVPVPNGGTTGQVLAKSSNDDYDTEWSTLNAADISDITASATALNSTSSATSGLTALSNGTSGITYQPVSHNHIINGAFDIWQRGTSFTFAGGTGGYTCDRFATFSAGGNMTVSRQSFTPGAAPIAGYEGSFFARISGASSAPYLYHYVEDVRTLAGQTVTLSFFAKRGTESNVSTTVYQTFGSGGSSNVTVNATAHSVTTSWNRYSVSFVMPSLSGKTIGTSSSLLLEFGATGLSDMDLWGIQLEAGAIATPFKRNAPSIQAELSACQRYYQSSFPLGVTPGNKTSSTVPNGNALSNYSPTVGNSYTTFKTFVVPMRVSASVSLFNMESGSSGTWTLYNSSGKIGDSAPSAIDAGSQGFLTYFTGTTVTVSNGAWSASAEL